jgi:hypothetical protein
MWIYLSFFAVEGLKHMGCYKKTKSFVPLRFEIRFQNK